MYMYMYIFKTLYTRYCVYTSIYIYVYVSILNDDICIYNIST